MTDFRLDNHHQTIIVMPAEMPNDEDFELWAHLFLHMPKITITEFETGADRHQLRFNYEHHNFNLNYEHYSNSIWINGEGTDAENLLAILTHYLITQMR